MKNKIFLIAVFMIFSIVSVNAQRGQGKGKHKKRSPEKIVRYEMNKVQDLFDLDDETAEKFYEIRKKMVFAEFKKISTKGEIYKSFRVLVEDGDITEDALTGYIKKVNELDTKRIEEKKQFYKKLKEIFTTKQIAEYILFEKKFSNDLRTAAMRHGRWKK